MASQKGVVSVLPLLVIVTLIGVASFVLFYTFAPTHNKIASSLNPKKNSFAATSPSTQLLYSLGGSNLAAQYQTLNPSSAATNGQKLAIADTSHNRVLIYSAMPQNSSALPDVVIGQVDFTHVAANQGGAVAANTLSTPISVLMIGNKLLIGDGNNGRVLIYNSIPTTNNAPADLVIGQPDLTQNSLLSLSSHSFSHPNCLASDGVKLVICDKLNSRVLVFNTIPTTNNPAADVVIGQRNFTTSVANQGSTPDANTLSFPEQAAIIGGELLITDAQNNRVLIYNSIPGASNASADLVIGQTDFTHNASNQGLISPANNTLSDPIGVVSDGTNLYLTDGNNRLMVFSTLPTTNNASADMIIPSSLIQLNFADGLLYAGDVFKVNVYGPSSATPPPTPPPTPNCSLQSQGDVNCNGTVDLLDYSVVVFNFGKHL